MSDRGDFQTARDVGLKARHETRLARAQKDQFMLMSLHRPEIAERFKTESGPIQADGCQLWVGGLAKDGYGKFSVWLNHSNKVTSPAHRLSLMLAVGMPESPELQAAHSCRNRHCVAPAHLRWATAEENAADRKRDGTQNRTIGRMHGKAKLTPDQVREIRFTYTLGDVTQRQLADRFGVAQSAISNIVNKRRWGFLDDPAAAAAECAYAEARQADRQETP